VLGLHVAEAGAVLEDNDCHTNTEAAVQDERP
jgi:hypothetical protein